MISPRSLLESMGVTHDRRSSSHSERESDSGSSSEGLPHRVGFRGGDANRRAIDESTATAPYQGGAGQTETCTVCQESLQEGERVRILPCLHRYHQTCIDRWLQQSRACPVCKYPIDAAAPGASSLQTR